MIALVGQHSSQLLVVDRCQQPPAEHDSGLSDPVGERERLVDVDDLDPPHPRLGCDATHGGVGRDTMRVDEPAELDRRLALAPQRPHAQGTADGTHPEEADCGPGSDTPARRSVPGETERRHGKHPAAQHAQQQERGERHHQEEEEAAIRGVESHDGSWSSFWSRRSRRGSARASSTKPATAASPKSRTTPRTAIDAASGTAA